MLEKEEVMRRIKGSGLVAVVRAESPEKARRIAEDCIAGGVEAIEVTFTVPFAHRALEELARDCGDRVLIGAGTVLDPETARIAILSGASFVVSPHLNPETARLCNRYRIPSMAGILTVREAVEALECGVDMLKLFPGGLFGPAFIRDLHGPLPQAPVMPTGGVEIANAGDWIRGGAAAIGAGSALVKGDVTANARAFLEEIRRARREGGGQ